MKAITFLFKFILGILLGIIIYICFVSLISKIPVYSNTTQNEEIEIYIASNGVHTDIVLPIKNEIHDWSKFILFENTKSKDSTFKFIAMGWGDRAFYLETPTWADLKFSTAIKATTGLSKSAIHATFYKSVKESSHCKKIKISKNQYQNIVRFTNDSFQIKNDSVIKIATSYTYGKNDAFYEAKGSYSLFYTCNTWANEALKSAEQKAALWTIFDKGIFYHYQ